MAHLPCHRCSDAELAARHRLGDPRAFGVLHARYAAALRGQARRALDPGLAEDVVQEAFERAHRFVLQDDRARDAGLELGAWMRTVVRRRCIDELRRATPVPVGADVHLDAATPGPCEQVVRREQLAELTRDLLALPARQRDAFVGHVLRGESHVEVAERLEVSVGASKNLVNRARSGLREHAAR